MRSKSTEFALQILRGLIPALILPLLIYTYISTGQTMSANRDSSDFYKFYLSGKRLSEGITPYWRSSNHTGSQCTQDFNIHHSDALLPCLHSNLNPPIFIAASAPISHLQYNEAWWTWSAISALCGIASVFILAYALTSDASLIPMRAVWGCLALFSFYPSYSNFAYGQLSFFLLLPLTLSWLCMRQGKEFSAGAWIGAISCIKPFFWLFFITFLLSRRKVAAKGFALSACILIIMSLALLGWPIHAEYIQILSKVTWTSSNWNASFAGFFSRVYQNNLESPWLHGAHATYILTHLCNLITLTLVAKTLLSTPPYAQSANAIYSLTVPAMILLSPLGWMYYLPLLALCSPTLLEKRAFRPQSIALQSVVLASVALMQIPHNLEFFSNVSPPWQWEESTYFYALIGIFTVTWLVNERMVRK